jgi:hypothetical protein
MPDLTPGQQYAESLAARLYQASREWFGEVDPYQGPWVRWFAMREELKTPYREMAETLIELQRERDA